MSVPAKWVILEIFEYRIVVPKQLGELCLKVDRGHGQTLTLVTVGADDSLGESGSRDLPQTEAPGATGGEPSRSDRHFRRHA
jgi:hypothetical protein